MNGIDDLIRSLAQMGYASMGDPLRQLASTIDDLSVTVGAWIPEQPTLPTGRFHNLDWEQR